MRMRNPRSVPVYLSGRLPYCIIMEELMTYPEFKMQLMSNIAQQAGCDAEVTIRSIRKNNGIFLDGLTVHHAGKNIAPTIYLERYWDKYREGFSIDSLTEEILEENRNYTVGRNLDIEQLLDFSRIRRKVMFRVINFDMNREFLETVPMRRALDLAVIYYYRVEEEELSGATCIVRNEDLERWHVTEEELWELALVNTPREEPSRISDIYDSLREIQENCAAITEGNPFMTQEGSDEGWFPIDVFPVEMDRSDKVSSDRALMLVLSNKTKVFGASCMLYPEVLRPLAEELGTDLYILPSSIHEVILMPVNELLSRDDLADMVKEINENEVLPQEVLSDNVYRYYADRDVILL